MYTTLRRSARRVTALRPYRAYHASVLPSHLSTASPEFKSKAEAMDALIADFEAKTATARLGGGVKAAERMRKAGAKVVACATLLGREGVAAFKKINGIVS